VLTLLGRKTRMCDRGSRRQFLQIGALGAFAGFGIPTFSLADILRAESRQGSKSNKAVIQVFLAGGPPHQDMWEIKTEAPDGVRGEFKPISTKVPGIQICEHFPRIAEMADKFAFLRAVVGCSGGHDGFQCYTGWRRADKVNGRYRPAIGPAAAYLLGQRRQGIPPSVALAEKTKHLPWSEPGGAGYLGAGYEPFSQREGGLEILSLRDINVERLTQRKTLLDRLVQIRPMLAADGMDAHVQQAYDILTSNALANAFDLSSEPAEIRELYGTGKPYKFQYDGASTNNELLLVARRLIECGVRSVTLSYGRWDSHGANFDLVRDHGPKLDQCVSALVQDLDERGMLDDVTVIAWGEFGRTPKINPGAGRDHWPPVSCALLAGGGMNTGQVIGATTMDGGQAEDRPVDVREVIATLYHNLGIEVHDPTFTIKDSSDRPHYLVPGQHPSIRELVG